MCSLRIFLALFCLLAALANALPTPSPMASPRSLLGMRYVYSANYPPPDPKDALLKSLMARRIVPRQAALDRGTRFERRMVLAKTNAPPMTIANNNMLSHQQLVPPPQPTPTPSPVPSVPTAPLAVPSSSSVAPTPSPGSRESKPKKYHHVKLKKTTATKPKPSHVSQE